MARLLHRNAISLVNLRNNMVYPQQGCKLTKDPHVAECYSMKDMNYHEEVKYVSESLVGS